VQLTPTAISAPCGAKRMHSASQRIDALRFEDLADCGRDLLVLAGNQARRLLHHRDRGAEAPENLRELEADVASTNDYKSGG